MAADQQPITPVPESADAGYPYTPPSGKKSGKKWPLLLLLLAFILLTAYVIYQQKTGQAEQRGGGGRPGKDGMPTVVSVAKAVTRDVNVYLDALGTVTPRNNVVVRSRVDGQLLKLYFTEGQMVKAGDLLAQIDPKTYQTQLAQVAGQLARDKALLENAQIDAARYKTLLGQDSISRQQVDTQESLVRQYRGAIEVDQAAVDSAKLQLDYARITAPISGRVGLRQVDPGNMIRTSDTNGIVTITQLQPITALFNIPEDNLTTVLQRIKSGTPVTVDAYDRSQQTRLAQGTLLTTDNQIDTTTGTVKLRAEFANRDEMLFPNQFVNVKVLVNVQKNAVVVPSSALQHGRTGDFVYVMQPEVQPEPAGPPGKKGERSKPSDSERAPATAPLQGDARNGQAADTASNEHSDKTRGERQGNGQGGNLIPPHAVTMTPVTLGAIDGDWTAVLSGLKPGDVVVTDGADKLKDGALARPSMVKPSTSEQAASGSNADGGKHRRHRPGTAQPDAVVGSSDANAGAASQTANEGQTDAGRPQHGGHRRQRAE